jgi:hypothetical protein
MKRSASENIVLDALFDHTAASGSSWPLLLSEDRDRLLSCITDAAQMKPTLIRNLSDAVGRTPSSVFSGVSSVKHSIDSVIDSDAPFVLLRKRADELSLNEADFRFMRVIDLMVCWQLFGEREGVDWCELDSVARLHVVLKGRIHREGHLFVFDSREGRFRRGSAAELAEKLERFRAACKHEFGRMLSDGELTTVEEKESRGGHGIPWVRYVREVIRVNDFPALLNMRLKAVTGAFPATSSSRQQPE